MANDKRDEPMKSTDVNPVLQTGEDNGRIKKPQQTDEKDLPRGSEPETHALK
jgi:hypothetical protein